MIQIDIFRDPDSEVLESKVNSYLKEVQLEGNKIVDIKYQSVPPTEEHDYFFSVMVIQDVI